MSQKDNITPITNFKVWNYNGLSFELDMSDADIAEHYESVVETMGKNEKTLPKTGKASDVLRYHYNWFIDFFDKMLGDGTGVQVCGTKPSVSNCYDAYDSFLAFIATQKAYIAQRATAVTSKYLNRAQRRAKKATK